MIVNAWGCKMKISKVVFFGFLFLLSGCTQQLLEAAQRDCQSFGHTEGSYGYTDCVEQRFSARQAQFQQGLRTMGNTPTYAPPPQYGSSGAQGTAFLQSNYVSGMNRVCNYNRMGSAFVM